MKFKEYKNKAMRTNGCGKDLFYFVPALVGEAGELIDELKKVAFHSHKENIENVIKEAGDTLWSLAYFENFKQINFPFADAINDDDVYDLFRLEKEWVGLGNKLFEDFLLNVESKTKEESLKIFIIAFSCLIGHISNEINVFGEINNFNATEMEKEFFTRLPNEYGGNPDEPTPSLIMHSLTMKTLAVYGMLIWLIEDHFGMKMEVIMEANIKKLEDRYKGKFSAEKSEYRQEYMLEKENV